MGDTSKFCVRVSCFVPWRARYFYLDSDPYVADGIFERHNLKVHFGDTFERSDTDMVIVVAWVYTWQVDEFEKCMDELHRALVIRKGRDYLEMCRKLNSVMNHV